jgi:hypothetical protein
MDRAQGKRVDVLTSVQAEPKLSLTELLDNAGISQTQAKRWQKLAAILEAEFEATFARPEKPSTSGIIAGIPDFFILYRGRAHHPEVKTEIGEQSRVPCRRLLPWRECFSAPRQQAFATPALAHLPPDRFQDRWQLRPG